MNYLDLFSGIGGFALGASWAGMKFDKHYFSEVDPYCVELYQKRFPDAIPLGDIKEIDCEKLADTGHADLSRWKESSKGQQSCGRGNARHKPTPCRGEWLITGGFPCQDISVAGKGAGIEGSRSGLWFEYWRVIRELRPRYAIIENVAILTRRGLDVVLSSLAEIGYDAEWQDIRAEDMGAPHRRERIWIVAYPGGERRRKENKGRLGMVRDVFPGQGREENTDTSQAFGSEMADAGSMRRAEGADEQGTECEGIGGDGSGIDSDSQHGGYWAVEPDVGRLTHDVSPWLDGSWEDGVPRLASKVPHRVDRLRGLGNSIIPRIAQLLFMQLMSIDKTLRFGYDNVTGGFKDEQVYTDKGKGEAYVGT